MKKIGGLFSLSGTIGCAGRQMHQAFQLAIEEINAEGGILGHMIEGVVKDCLSQEKMYETNAIEMIDSETIDTFFGCWTSDSRKAVLNVMESKNTLLWYPMQYEGFEQSKNIFYTGCTLYQQITPTLSWIKKHIGDRIYLVGSDYVYPKTANHIIKSKWKEMGGVILGEEYRSLGSRDFQGIINHIKELNPDAIINTINGDSNRTFFWRLSEAELDSGNCPVFSFSLEESFASYIGEPVIGHYACWSYFQSLPNKANRSFVDRYKKRFGSNSVTSDPVAISYAQVYLWKAIVEAIGNFSVEEITKHAHEVEIHCPAGNMRILENHHVEKHMKIGQVNASYQFDIIDQSPELIFPRPWLGINNSTLEEKEMVKIAMSEFPQSINQLHHATRKARELNRLNEDLKNMLNLRDHIERINQHDLKSPLSAIVGLSDLLMADTSLSKKTRDELLLIQHSGLRIAEMINHSLDLYKMETGTYDLNPTPIDVMDIVGTVTEELGELMRQKNIAIKTTQTDESREHNKLIVNGEELLCYSMISNLLLNAIEASIEDSEITIHTHSDADEWSVSIRNTGVVPEEIRDQFFEKYVTSNKLNGTGLGTYSAKMNAQTLGWDLTLDSSVSGFTSLIISGTFSDLPENSSCRHRPALSGHC